MELLIEKLKQIKDDDTDFPNWSLEENFPNWSLEEKKQLLNIYLIFCKKEDQIFNLIYRYHGCDSWEDIFRDYNVRYLQDKADGVEVAIEEITNLINIENEENINKNID
jgi:hypothetical protein